MKINKKFITISAALMMLAATSATAFASSSYNTSAESVAGLTGRTVDSVIAERTESGNTYGTIAKDAGVLDSFKAEVLELKKDALTEKVTNGTMTQERADEITAALVEAQASCDGTGSEAIGQQFGASFGNGENRNGLGKGVGNGMGNQGRGGMGLHDGSCLAQ